VDTLTPARGIAYFPTESDALTYFGTHESNARSSLRWLFLAAPTARLPALTHTYLRVSKTYAIAQGGWQEAWLVEATTAAVTGEPQMLER
jgi:hypothetical protein